MTMADTLGMMATLRVAFPQYYAKQTLEDAEAALKLWHRMFEADDVRLVKAAVDAFISSDTSGFPPSIGQIKDRCDKIAQEARGHDLTPAEAWALVSRAASRSYYNSQEEFEKLPDTVRAVLGSPATLHEYSLMDPQALGTVVASNFQRSYAARAEHVIQMRKWPDSVKALIENDAFKAIGAWPKEERPALQAKSQEETGGNKP